MSLLLKQLIVLAHKKYAYHHDIMWFQLIFFTTNYYVCIVTNNIDFIIFVLDDIIKQISVARF